MSDLSDAFNHKLGVSSPLILFDYVKEENRKTED